MRTVIPYAVVLPLVAFLFWLLRRRRTMRYGEIAPASVLQKKYGLYAENRPKIHIDPVNVPEHLRDLIPMAEKWGISDDIIRSDFEEKANEAEKREFQEALRGRTDTVNAWLDSFRGAVMPPDVEPFLYMLEALDESGLWPD
jgi:hypothetical protein